MSVFHENHGRSIDISEDGRLAQKVFKIGSNWAYSKRDVKENEIVCIRIIEMSAKSSQKPLIVGFTDENPQHMPCRPKASYHLCNQPLIVPASELREGVLLVLIYDIIERLVYLGVDGHLKAVCSLWGLRDASRWLAVRIDGPVKTVQMNHSPDGQWSSFVYEASRISKIFKSERFFNCGAPGLQKPQLTFMSSLPDTRVQFSQDNRQATLEGCSEKEVVLYSARPILLNELISIQLTRVSYGSIVEVFTISENPTSYNTNVRSSDDLSIRLTHNDTVHLTCTEKGMLVYGLHTFVQSSTRFYPIAPAWLGLRITSPASFLTIEFEEAHKLPQTSSIRDGGKMVVKNRAFSTTDKENSLLCKICFLYKMDTVLTPCHHMSMCANCTKKVMDKVDWKCPVCGEEVEGFFKVKTV